MKPYYQEEGITIYHGDAMDILPSLGPLHAMVTDPPFGIGWSQATWNDDPQAYDQFMRWLVRAAERVIPQGWCFVFQAMPNIHHFHRWFPEGWRIYAACKNFAQIRPTAIWHSWDPVVFWHNGPNSGPNSGHLNRDYFVGNVAGVFGEKTTHPCPRPLDTMRHIVGLAAPEGAIIVDPFMGRGTTLRAAKEMGRQAIGIEINETYCAEAITYLRQGVLPLWAARQPS